MPRISDERRAAQRRRIIDAMLASMRRKGLAETSMADVIEESGMSAGAIYGYFAGREEIVIAVGMEVVRGKFDAVLALSEQTPVPHPSQVVRALIRSVPHEVLDGGAVIQVWGVATTQPELRAAVKEVLEEAQTTAAQFLARWFAQEGRDNPEALGRAAAPALVGLVQGYIVRTAVLGEDVADAFCDSVAVLLGADLSDPPAARPSADPRD